MPTMIMAKTGRDFIGCTPCVARQRVVPPQVAFKNRLPRAGNLSDLRNRRPLPAFMRLPVSPTYRPPPRRPLLDMIGECARGGARWRPLAWPRETLNGHRKRRHPSLQTPRSWPADVAGPSRRPVLAQQGRWRLDDSQRRARAGEDAETTARREFVEELGTMPTGALSRSDAFVNAAASRSMASPSKEISTSNASRATPSKSNGRRAAAGGNPFPKSIARPGSRRTRRARRSMPARGRSSTASKSSAPGHEKGGPRGPPFPKSGTIAQLGSDGPAGPAVAGRRQRDLVGDQRVLERRDTGLVVARLALGDRGRLRRIDLRGAVLAPLVAQRLAVAAGIREDRGVATWRHRSRSRRAGSAARARRRRSPPAAGSRPCR